MAYRKCVCIDFDGVIHSYERGWQGGAIYGDIDVEGIHLLHRAGFAVAVLTARQTDPVHQALSGNGFAVLVDYPMAHSKWDGGSDGRTVLVTNRKVAAVAYIDDRAVLHKHGDDWVAALASVDALSGHPDGFSVPFPREAEK
jgi:hypothetical protein